MKQIAQNYRSGELDIKEVPPPILLPNKVLVQNQFSVISRGTERTKIEQSKLSYLGKAMARPDQFKKVLEGIRQEGIVKTYQRVMTRLDLLTPLGYSSSGVVVDIGEKVTGFCKGDRVACASQDACHAEVISVSPMMCVKIPKNISMDYAAFTTILTIRKLLRS